MNRFYYVISWALLLFLNSQAFADEIRIATGHTFINRVFEPVRLGFKDATGNDLSILFRDPVPALRELVKGNADVAGASLTAENWLNIAGKEHVQISDPKEYKSLVVVTEKSHFVVNVSNKINSLSTAELKGIFTGRIKNWKEVGGIDAPILVVWPTISSGAVIIVKQNIMDNKPLTSNIFDVESMGEVPEAVAVTPEAIGVITSDTLPKNLKEVAKPIERPLTLLYKATPSKKLQRLLDYLQGEGKHFIK